jgi:hypothetical protein
MSILLDYSKEKKKTSKATKLIEFGKKKFCIFSMWKLTLGYRI